MQQGQKLEHSPHKKGRMVKLKLYNLLKGKILKSDKIKIKMQKVRLRNA